MTKTILFSLSAVGLILLPAHALAQAPQAPAAPAATPAPAEAPVPNFATVGEAYRVELQVGAYVSMPSTIMYSDTESISATSGSTTTTTVVNGTNLDFKNQLGLKNQVFPEAHLTIRLVPKQKLRGDYIPLFYKQTTTLGSDITFNGQSYLAGDTVESTLHWNEWKLAYEFDPIVSDRGYVGGMVAMTSLSVSGATANSVQSGTASVNILMPGLGVTGRFYAQEKLSVTGDIFVFDLPGSETSTHGRVIDVQGYATYNLNKHLGVQAGYRFFDTSHTWSSPLNTGSMTIGGPFVGGTAHF